jgi:hypothetical protein
MSRKTPAPVPWQPMLPAVRIDKTEEQIAAAREATAAMGFDPDEVEALMREPVEMWKNHRYTAIVARGDDGVIHHISLRRNDRKPHMPWRDLQRIKNELAGPEAEAIELFPAESRLVDCANQRHLWVWPPGTIIPVGFASRATGTPEQAAAFGAVQS